MPSRIIIKLSGEMLKGDATDAACPAFNHALIKNYAGQLARVVQSGTRLAIVVGGGNIWRGRSASPEMDRIRADQMGMLATVINGLYLQDAFRREGVDACVMTPPAMGPFTEVYDYANACRWYESKRILIYAAGLGHPFFSTDTVAALRGAEHGANVMLFAKTTDGVYDSDPAEFPAARRFRRLSYATAMAKNLSFADLTALQLLTEAKIPSFVFKLNEPNSLLHACAWPDTHPLTGTFIDLTSEEEYHAHSKNTIR
jgi:uridylate kinase